MATNLEGPGIYLAQFAGDNAPSIPAMKEHPDNADKLVTADVTYSPSMIADFPDSPF